MPKLASVQRMLYEPGDRVDCHSIDETFGPNGAPTHTGKVVGRKEVQFMGQFHHYEYQVDCGDITWPFRDDRWLLVPFGTWKAYPKKW